MTRYKHAALSTLCSFAYTITALSSLVLANYAEADPKESCFFRDSNGVEYVTHDKSAIPQPFRATARCVSGAQDRYLAPPDEVALKGNIREQSISTPLGRMNLRWPRSVEKLFGRTPERALVDAAQAVSRALKSQGFPLNVQQLSQSWNVVFMDETLPTTQIPYSLISNCHPAWMTPPANLYVVSQRVVAGCGGSSGSSQVNDAQLAQILVHEIGHAIEHQLLEGAPLSDRMRAEGFASWFEQYGSDYSSAVSGGRAEKRYGALAFVSFQSDPHGFRFDGSAHDYARASMYFHAVVEKIGVRGLMDIYAMMTHEKINFTQAIKKRLGWDEKKLNEQGRSVAERLVR
jgi:hypothetical protein